MPQVDAKAEIEKVMQEWKKGLLSTEAAVSRILTLAAGKK